MKSPFKLAIISTLILFIIFLLVLSSAILISRYNPVPVFRQSPPDNTVLRVIDGDTIEMASGEIIRLICIDTPEQGEEGYEESTNFLSNLILNREVTLESDIQDKDSYGRLLRYVYLDIPEQRLFINKILYQQGYAEMMIIPPSDSKCGEISSSRIP
ncbi:MAG: thermonuclease family protein [Nanoarchaeota archaeon]|nr:thermonuclease family protein [Nanoarchaeota archaeon]